MEIVELDGWGRCARFATGGIEAFVTLEFGPRVIRYGRVGGKNLLYENPKHRGLRGGVEYRGYGGHRLWIAPEDPDLTMQPDNEPVEVRQLERGTSFASRRDKNGFQKLIALEMMQSGVISLRHEISYAGDAAVEIAPWALTVMAPGGECVFPLAPYQPHPEKLLPSQPLVLWSYTDMADPRWQWGPRTVRLAQTAADSPQKAGCLIPQGIAAYALSGTVFLKRFSFNERAVYADFGCNFETFTRHDMLEVETLGPLTRMENGDKVEHLETWYLEAGEPPARPDDAADWLEQLGRDRPLVTDP